MTAAINRTSSSSPTTPSRSFISRALDQANANALRIALYQATGDEELLRMPVQEVPVWGGTWSALALLPDDVETVKQKALDMIGDMIAADAVPTDETLRRLMGEFVQAPMTPSEIAFGMEETAFRSFPRGVDWETRPDEAHVAAFHVAVIGAGLGGVAAAIQLKRLGIPFTVLERNRDWGGTWQVNDYPDARVDIVSQHYQYSFEKNYKWKDQFATQAEMKQYIDHCVAKHDIAGDIRLNSEVLSADWDEVSAVWTATVRNGDGKEESLKANAIISAAGLFNTPRLPDIPGLESFPGPVFHTTDWNHDIDLADRKVALIGTGSTGAQLMPVIAREVAQLTVFQRTPNWVLGLEGYRDPVSEETRWLFDTIPYYWNWNRFSLFYSMMHGMDGLHDYDPEWQARGGIVSARNDGLRSYCIDYVRFKIGDRPDLMSKCIPDFAPWGKRMVMDNGWFDALRRPNVDLVTDRIDCVRPEGVVTTDGTTHEADVIIVAAGFHVASYVWPTRYQGRGGVTLEEKWSKDGPRAYLGVMVPDFPNLFIMYGPDGQARSGGLITWLEIWSRFAVGAIVRLLERDQSSIDVRPDAFEQYNERLDAANRMMIWREMAGRSYYVNNFGRPSVMTPWDPLAYADWLREPDESHYEIR